MASNDGFEDLLPMSDFQPGMRVRPQGAATFMVIDEVSVRDGLIRMYLLGGDGEIHRFTVKSGDEASVDVLAEDGGGG